MWKDWHVLHHSKPYYQQIIQTNRRVSIIAIFPSETPRWSRISTNFGRTNLDWGFSRPNFQTQSRIFLFYIFFFYSISLFSVLASFSSSRPGSDNDFFFFNLLVHYRMSVSSDRIPPGSVSQSQFFSYLFIAFYSFIYSFNKFSAPSLSPRSGFSP